MGYGGGRASTAGGRVSDSCSGGAAGSMEAPNMTPTCNDPDAPRSAVPGMLLGVVSSLVVVAEA